MQKLNFTFLLTVLLSMVGANGFAHDIEVKNADGTTIYYVWANKQTELAVSYRGKDMSFYSNEYSGYVVIPESVTYNGKTYPVTGIGAFAFYYCRELFGVSIPNSVTSIGNDAFSSCNKISNMYIPNSVTVIGVDAFKDTGIFNSAANGIFYVSKWACGYKGDKPSGTLTIEQGTRGIAGGLFKSCDDLTNVIIPNSVKCIGVDAFRFCYKLSSVTIPSSVTTIGSGAFFGCSALTSVTIPNSVTSIGDRAFYRCSGLASVTIPNSVTSIDYSTFESCSGLTSVTIPNSVTHIGERAFSSCSGLTSVTIPNSVTHIGERAFFRCSSLKSVKLPDNIEKINSSAFESSCKLLCKEGSATLISLWEAPTKAYSLEGKELPRPTVSSSNTQTTLTLNIDDYYKQYNYSSNHSIKDGLITLKDLFPEESVYTMVEMSTTDGKKKLKLTEGSYMTKSISPNIKFEVSPTSIKPMGTYTSGDASVTSKKMYFGNNLMETNSMELTGLNPKASYGFRYEIVVTSAKGTTRTYQATKYIETSALSLKTLQPKVISSGNVIVAAETNINVDEEKVGFEWRRTDWTSDFPSNTGAAALFDGTMEGYIRNLNTDKLWKVRPYYLSNSGTYYYGDWMGVDPTNTSYFEPTVHTYAKIEVKGNTALIKGYALQGTDGVKVQGFKYWRRVSKASAEDSDKAMAKRAPNIPSNATTVTSSGQVMTAELANLGYETNYSFVAFVTTNTGETFYGEEQTFTTGANPVGIEGVEISAEEKRLNNAPKYYDMQGHQLNDPIRGLNIVRMADGTVKKVLVK